MIKKSLLSAFVLVAGISIAGTASAQNSAYEGWYAGGQVGYSIVDFDISVTGVGTLSDDMDGFGGGGFIGFGGTNGSLYGSIEAELGYDGADWSVSAGGTSLDLEAQLTYGLGFRAGWVDKNNLLIYGRVGWIRTNVEASVTGLGSDDEDFDGFRFGGGVEGRVSDNIGVRGEYTYTIYDDIDLGSGVNVDADQHLFRVGVAYYF